jgi:hypothetical protein
LRLSDDAPVRVSISPITRLLGVGVFATAAGGFVGAAVGEAHAPKIMANRTRMIVELKNPFLKVFTRFLLIGSYQVGRINGSSFYNYN